MPLCDPKLQDTYNVNKYSDFVVFNVVVLANKLLEPTKLIKYPSES